MPVPISFRREGKLQEHLEKAKRRVQELHEQADDPKASARQKKACERGAREKVERLQVALAQHKQLAIDREARKKGGDGETTRISRTDPDARKMLMPDGGFRPAFNVQFAATTDAKIIVGVDVLNQGNDAGQMEPMMEQIQERYGQAPERMLVDAGFTTLVAFGPGRQRCPIHSQALCLGTYCTAGSARRDALARSTQQAEPTRQCVPHASLGTSVISSQTLSDASKKRNVFEQSSEVRRVANRTVVRAYQIGIIG